MAVKPTLSEEACELLTAHILLPGRIVTRLMFHQPWLRDGAIDPESVANDALVEAARQYDPARGNFRAFAGIVIRRRVLSVCGSKFATNLKYFTRLTERDCGPGRPEMKELVEAVESLPAAQRSAIRRHFGLERGGATASRRGLDALLIDKALSALRRSLS